MKSRKILLAKLLDDWPAKVLSLAGAAALFFFIQLNRLEDRPMSVPLRVKINSQYALASEYPSTVRLVLRGEGNSIGAILENDLVASIDLSGFNSSGSWKVPVNIERTGSALGISPLEISADPSEIQVVLEAKVVKELPVIPTFKGFLEPGYEMVGSSIVPARVETAGPASLMDRVTELQTEPIELTSRFESFSVRINIQESESLLEYLSSPMVDFSAEISKAVLSRTMENLEIGIINLDEGLEIKPGLPTGGARITATRAVIDEISANAILLFIDCVGIYEEGQYSLPVFPAFSNEVELDSWYPQVLNVNINRKTGEPE